MPPVQAELEDEAGSETSSAASFGGANSYVAVRQRKFKLRDCRHFWAAFDKNYSRNRIGAYVVLFRT